MSNSVDPDEMAHYEPSHLDLRCLQKPILSPMAVKELTNISFTYQLPASVAQLDAPSDWRP